MPYHVTPYPTTSVTSYITGSKREHSAAKPRLRSRISGDRNSARKSSRLVQRE